MSLLRTVRDLDRMRQITQVLARHGFGEIATRMGLPGASSAEAGPRAPSMQQLGVRIRLVLQDLGTTFVKLGQILSTRADLLPAELITELERLQDDVPPVEAARIREVIEEELGVPVDDLFLDFDDEPLACASVAQVHRAELALDDAPAPVPIVVKVQRPGVARTVRRDLSLLHSLARVLEGTIPELRIYSPVGLVTEFEEAITAELDFTVEARNAERFADNFLDEPAIVFPRVYRHVSSRRVLALEFFDGLKVDEAVRRGADGPWIARTAMRILLRMVFEDGFFHADPHPGNILILPPPRGARYARDEELRIGLLDVGLVGRLSPELRDRAMDLLLAAAREDADALADAMLAIGRQRRRVDEPAFRRYVGRLAERHLGRPLSEIDASAILRDIVVGAMKFEIEVPSELTMLFRSIMTMEGVGKQIDPDLDILQVARPHLLRMVKARYHPARVGRELLRDAGRLGSFARELPEQLRDIARVLQRGELRVHTVDPEAARATERLGRRVRAGLLSSTLLGSGTALLISGDHATLGYGLLGGAALWLLGHLGFEGLGRRYRAER